MIDDQKVIEFLQDINNSISALIDITETFIKLYIETKKVEVKEE